MRYTERDEKGNPVLRIPLDGAGAVTMDDLAVIVTGGPIATTLCRAEEREKSDTIWAEERSKL